MIAAIVLAAGTSSRLKRPKQLLDYQGRPLIRHAVETVVNSNVEQVLVVVGAASEEVSAALQGLPVQIVKNKAYACGQSTSVRAGLKALAQDSPPEGVLFALGDQPLVTGKTIDILLAAFKHQRGIVVPYHEETPGNPVIFAKQFLPYFNSLRGDVGGRQLIKRFNKEVHRVDVEDPGVVFDIDNWEDYEKLKGS
ncbi:nucleotidyltransferase family protein [Dethiobacter alkaliphilus]|uniref:4-diphosphocytidyl-2C-methyl-D-erythritol synthase n=1 Tax=Dethiobacter alkaliphilus AHT 1 TaxID=555088 RepID=C0GH10_DETAL|nr:nucleotidyltransferase family protein [Dethiobacter alkaliphilus]EEG77312.1 4-diphosphocytidyl-2C-methyl-D-erythritol synthase [Dethiobacter alkaliphilus AHT 1]